MLSVEEEASQLVKAIQELTRTSRSLVDTSNKIVRAAEQAIERTRFVHGSPPLDCAGIKERTPT